jgi:hypothetical protein
MEQRDDEALPGGPQQPLRLLAQETRAGMHTLAAIMAAQGLTPPHSDARWAALMCVTRAAECLESLEMLSLLDRERDAAVLLAVLLELQYDVTYIGRNPLRATDWLTHTAEGRKPWKVRDLQEALYPDPAELEACKANYRRVSMIKHSNPVAGTHSFPVALSGRVLSARPPSTDLVAANLYGAASTCIDISAAAQTCLGPATEAASPALQSLRDVQTRLNRDMEERMIDILVEVGGYGA